MFCTVDGALGYIIFCNHIGAVRYFSAVLIAALDTFALNIFKSKSRPALPMLISFLSVFSTGIVMNFKASASVGEYALIFAEAVLAGGGSFFFDRAVNCNFRRIKFKALPITDMTCIIVSGALVLSSLSFIEINGIAPARIFAVLIILIAVRFSSQRSAIITSLCLGFALGISREDSLFLLGAYAFSALVSSLFTSFSSLGIGISCTLSMAFFTLRRIWAASPSAVRRKV